MTEQVYLGNPNLKRANVQQEWTKEELQEYQRCMEDPLYFIQTYVRIVSLDEGLVPFKMYDFQKEMVGTFHNNRFTICKLPRQSGKSTIIIAYLLHYVLFNPNVNVAILANKSSTARDILGRLQLGYEHLPKWLQQGVINWNKGNIELENKIRLSQDICSLALSLRKKEKIKVRQPLPKILVPFKNNEEKKVLEEISEFIKSEINVKTIELITDSSKILVKKAKPNFKLLGPKYGKTMKTVVGLINNLNNEQIENLSNSLNVTIHHGDEEFTLKSEDVEIYFEDIEGWLVASENGKTIALDTTIDESLKNEGMCREIVNRIQNLRKDSEFNVSDKIIIELETNNLVEKAIFANLDYVKNETLAVDLIFKQNLESKSIIEFDNISIKAKIYKTN